MRGVPNRCPKAAMSPAPRRCSRNTSTGCSAKACLIQSKVSSSSFDKSTPSASVPSASPSGRNSGVAMDDPPSLVYSSVYAGYCLTSNRAYQECDRSSAMKPRDRLYRTAGVDTEETQSGLHKIITSIKETWPAPGGVGAVSLDIGYFANVIDIGGGVGLAISTDGVGSKSVIAQMMRRYDTIGIDCVAMNVNDLLCVGARPVSMVDYIAVEEADAGMLGAIAIGLAEGARQAAISIPGGEISSLKDIVRGFDLVGAAVGIVPLDRIITGRDLVPGDFVIGVESSGIHSNGLTLARRVLFDQGKSPIDHVFPELGIPLGEELLRPTLIYVPEILDIIEQVPTVRALINITGDGLLNLPRVDAKVGFLIDDLPPLPRIFRLIQQHGGVDDAEMFEVFNMGVGFCVLVSKNDAAPALSILHRHGRRAQVIGRVIADDSKGVYLPRQRLAGRAKVFKPI